MRLNVQPSLSRNRIDLLRKANAVIEGNKNFKFAYADMHGNLKFILNKPFNGKCDALRDLVPFVQFKKRGKHPWRSVTFRNTPQICQAGVKKTLVLSAYCEEDEF